MQKMMLRIKYQIPLELYK